MGSVIVITSGKGGTGKTSLTGGIGAALALQGRQVLCIDADVGLRNLDITLGMTDAALMDFSDVMAGRCPLARAVAPHPSVSGLFYSPHRSPCRRISPARRASALCWRKPGEV